jgi:hypothetical protein
MHGKDFIVGTANQQPSLHASTYSTSKRRLVAFTMAVQGKGRRQTA